MEATKQNVENIRSSLTFDLMFMKEPYYDKLTEEQMKELDDEIDRKIEKLLPNYNGELPPSVVFNSILERTINNFVKSLL